MSRKLNLLYDSVYATNDHLLAVVEDDLGAGPVPVDQLKIYREGDRYLVRGQWVSYDKAVEHARQVLEIED